MPVVFRYYPLPDHCKNAPGYRRKGMSERELRKRLERQGWTVWRGALINILRRDELYPNVRRKYEILKELLQDHHPHHFELLEYYCAVHHGLPDFLCFRNKEFLFVECKLGHEQLLPGQKICIQKLQKLGFKVEVHKLVQDCTKTRLALVDLEEGEKIVIEKQLRLTKKLMKV